MLWCRSFLLFIVLLPGCSVVSSFSKLINNYPVVHVDSDISLINKKPQNKIYIKVSNLVSMPSFFAEQKLKAAVAQNKRYQVVETPEDADLVVGVKVLFVSPITEETFDRISKYWAYKSITQSTVINSAEDLSGKASFSMVDEGFAAGVGPAEPRVSFGGGDKGSIIDGLAKQDVIAGTVIGGSVAAAVGAAPAMIAVGTIAGGSAAGILEKLTSIAFNMAVIDVVIKEKVALAGPDTGKIKYKNFSVLSKNMVSEVYIDRAAGRETTVEHGSRLSVMVKSMAIVPSSGLSDIASDSIVQVVGEMIR